MCWVGQQCPQYTLLGFELTLCTGWRRNLPQMSKHGLMHKQTKTLDGGGDVIISSVTVSPAQYTMYTVFYTGTGLEDKR